MAPLLCACQMNRLMEMQSIKNVCAGDCGVPALPERELPGGAGQGPAGDAGRPARAGQRQVRPRRTHSSRAAAEPQRRHLQPGNAAFPSYSHHRVKISDSYTSVVLTQCVRAGERSERHERDRGRVRRQVQAAWKVPCQAAGAGVRRQGLHHLIKCKLVDDRFVAVSLIRCASRCCRETAKTLAATRGWRPATPPPVHRHQDLLERKPGDRRWRALAPDTCLAGARPRHRWHGSSGRVKTSAQAETRPQQAREGGGREGVIRTQDAIT